MFSFIKNNIYVIAGAFCVLIICAVYFAQNNEGALPAEPESVVIFSADSESAGEETSAENSSAGSNGSAEENFPPEAPSDSLENSEPQIISVYITGEVLAPGVYELPSGSRVWQALEQAGGFTELAAEDYINLAAFVTDTQHIAVPSLNDPAVAEISPGTTPYGVTAEGEIIAEAAGENNSPHDSGGSFSGEGLININTADSALLQTLPGIGEQIASYIIEYREQNGEFKTVEEILNVERIGAVTFGKIKDKITVGGV